ncbi:hypothetical protein AB6A40_006830 [Gnathostoma spinigerum]|uniref:Uncharacterized protein n=1 Tax=Gnathostoma spinigerum TaxID=75299 RepID=A0ABD6EK33_9BILA
MNLRWFESCPFSVWPSLDGEECSDPPRYLTWRRSSTVTSLNVHDIFDKIYYYSVSRGLFQFSDYSFLRISHLFHQSIQSDSILMLLSLTVFIDTVAKLCVYEAFSCLPKWRMRWESQLLYKHGKSFILERIVLIGFIVVPSMKNITNNSIEEIGIFTVWYFLMWSVYSLSVIISYRFEILHLEEESITSNVFSYICLGAVSFAAAVISATMISTSLIASYYLSPFHSLLMLSESCWLCVRSIYNLFRLLLETFYRDDSDKFKFRLCLLKSLVIILLEIISVSRFCVVAICGFFLLDKLAGLLFIVLARRRILLLYSCIYDCFRHDELLNMTTDDPLL